MRTLICRLMVLFSCASFVACTSLHTLVNTNASQATSAVAILPAIAPNDSLAVTMRDGTRVKIDVINVTPEFIEGTQGNDEQLKRIEVSDVVKIERREFDGVKTVLLIVAISVGIYLIAEAAGTASLASNL